MVIEQGPRVTPLVWPPHEQVQTANATDHRGQLNSSNLFEKSNPARISPKVSC